MEIEDIIKKTTKLFNITREQLLDTSSHSCALQRRFFISECMKHDYNFYDVERATGVLKDTWRAAYKAYMKFLANIAASQHEVEKKINKTSIGFRYSEEDELRIKYAKESAEKFMADYGKGAQPLQGNQVFRRRNHRMK
jgi:hypothetical protein